MQTTEQIAVLPEALQSLVKGRLILLENIARQKRIREHNLRLDAWRNLRRAIEQVLVEEIGATAAAELMQVRFSLVPPNDFDRDADLYHFRLLGSSSVDGDEPEVYATFFRDPERDWRMLPAAPSAQLCSLPGQKEKGPFVWYAHRPYGCTLACRDLVTALAWAIGDSEFLEWAFHPEPPPF